MTKRITVTLTEDQVNALKECIGVTVFSNMGQYDNPEYAIGTTVEKMNTQIQKENAFLVRIHHKLNAE